MEVRPAQVTFWEGLRSNCLLLLWKLGCWTPPDRRVLNERILPYYATEPGFERILFVGIKKYNRRNRALFARRTYTTIDPDLASARYGGERHITAVLEDLSAHVTPSTFDVIVVNGVIGFGLNDSDAVEKAVAACRRALRAGGHLIISLNENTPARIDLSLIAAAEGLEPQVIAPFADVRLVVHTPLRERTHTYYAFGRRPDDVSRTNPLESARR